MDMIKVYALKALFETGIVNHDVTETKCDGGEFEQVIWINNAADVFANESAKYDNIDTLQVCYEHAEVYAKLVASEVLAAGHDEEDRTGPASEYTCLPPEEWLQRQACTALMPAQVHDLTHKLFVAEEAVRELRVENQCLVQDNAALRGRVADLNMRQEPRNKKGKGNG